MALSQESFIQYYLLSMMFKLLIIGFNTGDPLFVSVFIDNSCCCYSHVYRTVEQWSHITLCSLNNCHVLFPNMGQFLLHWVVNNGSPLRVSYI